MISKRVSDAWALEHLPESWHDAIPAADRTHDGAGTPKTRNGLRATMAPFVAMVPERLPRVDQPPSGSPRRWSAC